MRNSPVLGDKNFSLFSLPSFLSAWFVLLQHNIVLLLLLLLLFHTQTQPAKIPNRKGRYVKKELKRSEIFRCDTAEATNPGVNIIGTLKNMTNESSGRRF